MEKEFLTLVSRGSSEKITNYNVPKDCCCEVTCSKKSRWFFILRLEGPDGVVLETHISLCGEHNKVYGNMPWKLGIKKFDLPLPNFEEVEEEQLKGVST